MKSCAGCCTTDGNCMAGTDDDACGSAPRICVDCAARGMACGVVGSARDCVGH